MSPAMIMMIAEMFIKYVPGIAEKISESINKPENVTKEDWDKLFNEARDTASKVIEQLNNLKPVG